jgi:FAD-dependent urate hydroxylase
MTLSDTAHSMPPTLAQGMDHALEDACTMAAELRRGDDIHGRRAPQLLTRPGSQGGSRRQAIRDGGHQEVPTLDGQALLDPLVARDYTRWLCRISNDLT